MTTLEYILYLSLCTASISYTITWAGIFEGLRKQISKLGNWFEDLIHCPYCLGHYIALAIMLVTYNNCSQYFIPVSKSIVLNFIISWFSIMCVTSILHCVMLIAYKPVSEYLTVLKIRKYNKQFRNDEEDEG